MSPRYEYHRKWKKTHPEKVKLYAQRNFASLNALKDKPCKDCKRKYPPECMDWDHVRGRKLFSIGMKRNCARARVLREIKKCDLVCANCHRIRTRRRAS